MLELVELLADEISKYTVEWKNVETIIDQNIDNINDYEDEECVLSDLFHFLYNKGNVALDLTKMFLNKGFDVKANDEKNGLACLVSLCFSIYDYYIPVIANILFDSGANPYLSFEEEDKNGILNYIDFKLGYWCYDEPSDWDCANIYEAYYQLAERVQLKKEYEGIKSFRSSVGLVIKKVELIKEKKICDAKEQIRESYVITCDNQKLVISDYIDFVVNPYVYEEAIDIIDVSDKFNDILGLKIKSLRFNKSYMAKLSLSEGRYLFARSKYVENHENMDEWLFLK